MIGVVMADNWWECSTIVQHRMSQSQYPIDSRYCIDWVNRSFVLFILLQIHIKVHVQRKLINCVSKRQMTKRTSPSQLIQFQFYLFELKIDVDITSLNFKWRKLPHFIINVTIISINSNTHTKNEIYLQLGAAHIELHTLEMNCSGLWNHVAW